MRLKKVKYRNKEALIIYLTQAEVEDNIIKEKIIEYKEGYSSVAVFVSGRKNIEKVIKDMVQESL
ncbi:hypothetical protein BJV85_001632 [Clostridium acetobutylicum]|uniref:Uncharacterized protein n=1 Tax=Clostridium acetobutylicum (strain ATCC 824 / DSM 792 / JCM 1419 / IAM 19013 / LMG 5710 / NBRC 13948 / NRRL B-527 / VKM B-1787 / 2291 / W) TaxID=272562 RepID=Q97GW7_CLOAB|nr:MULTISPECIES: hypothetical protein [Clostridium]AAK80205.1 Hypothetical protein CA_C2248 [Clostridium acetobutylicum ATCC 824]ADZ21299.1 Conserved hypothetical protein [Clostridium acetobutylicum EA 2018]AEI32246.1 hypothetical protein SMB_G2281 [Clostridium acetobutylicum DSM 1731]AWV79370.1 hypothetical protein DK921_04510 [Clostridium acetobutylicum]KHD38390.1 hypothetical protein NL50_02465 [Clostridium acetobutylicum]